jgi:hypothetical protein
MIEKKHDVGRGLRSMRKLYDLTQHRLAERARVPINHLVFDGTNRIDLEPRSRSVSSGCFCGEHGKRGAHGMQLARDAATRAKSLEGPKIPPFAKGAKDGPPDKYKHKIQNLKSRSLPATPSGTPTPRTAIPDESGLGSG